MGQRRMQESAWGLTRGKHVAGLGILAANQGDVTAEKPPPVYANSGIDVRASGGGFSAASFSDFPHRRGERAGNLASLKHRVMAGAR